MKTHLNKLELHGFKSFAEKTVIKFHQGITAVVGPNGCGKSNIVDALLWVLGEQRIKNLRGENNEDLIFSGSSSKKPLGMTEVGITFTNSKDDVYIARRFFRSGDSKYILNEKYCRNKDIQEELYNLNLGGRNYFIFEQGSIEKLVSLKPFERRMLIEEAAGISQYLIRKKETANKLIIAEQNLDNLEILSADKENRLRELKNQANYATRYRTLKSESLDYIKAFLFKKFKKINGEFEKRKKDVEKFINSEILIAKELSQLEKEYSGNEGKKWEMDKFLKEKQKSLYELNQDILSKRSEVEKLKQRKDFIIQRINENERSIDQNNKLITDKGKQIKELEAIVNTKKDEYEVFSGEFNKKKDEISKIRSGHKEIESEKNSLKSEIFSSVSSITALNNEIHENEKRSVAMENEIRSKQRFITELKNSINNENIGSEEKKHKDAELLFSKAEKDLDSLKGELENCRTVISSITSDIQLNNNEIHSLNKQRGDYQRMKEKVAGAQNTGNKKLQEFIDSDKQNFNIIENFYYDEMGSYVIEDESDLKNPELEKIILGSSSFANIPDGISMEDGFIDKIKNLFIIKDPDLKKKLKDGVLVSDLINGINIYRKYGVPVVTRNAEIITLDGILIKKRSSGVLDIMEEIRNIDKAISIAKNSKSKLEKSLTMEKEKELELAQRVKSKSLSARELEHDFIRIRSDINNMISSREKNLKRIQTIEFELERHNSEIKNFSEQLKIRTEERKELEIKNKELIKKREDLEKKESSFGLDLNVKEKEFFGLENSLNLSREKLNSLESELKRLLSERISLKKDIEHKEKETSDLSMEIKEIAGTIEEFESKKNTSIKEKDKSEEDIRKNELTLDELTSKIKTENDLLTQKRSELDGIKEAKSKEEIELAALKKDIFSLEEISFKELNSELKDIVPDEKILELEITDIEEKVDISNERLIKMRDSNRLNFSAESEYDLLAKDHEILLSQRADVINSIKDMNNAIQKIDDESKISFKEAFEEIRNNFKKTFQILFEGGEADLTLTDLDNILETGLEIMAQPPGKRLQGLRLLSGGEKTLTSLAFLFALFEYKPSPFCVFDEVDASLDEANIQRFLKFLHKLKEKTQFLIITHNFKTMEEADYIYGISMNEPSVSSVYSMKMTSNNSITSQ